MQMFVFKFVSSPKRIVRFLDYRNLASAKLFNGKPEATAPSILIETQTPNECQARQTYDVSPVLFQFVTTSFKKPSIAFSFPGKLVVCAILSHFHSHGFAIGSLPRTSQARFRLYEAKVANLKAFGNNRRDFIGWPSAYVLLAPSCERCNERK